MKLIFIYGAPAAGKLTVATELGRLTSFKVFDNHLSIDCILPVFDYGTPPFGKLVERIRVDVLEETARAGVDVIFTFVYAHPEDAAYVGRVCTPVERLGGTVHFVQLTCTTAVQELRVQSPERAVRRKVSSVETVRMFNEQHDFSTPIPGRESLRIDNTNLAAIEVARQIVEHYGLPTP